MESNKNPPCKVLVIIGSMNLGGCESDILRIMPKLDRTKFEVRVMAFWQRGTLADDLEATGIKLYPPVEKYVYKYEYQQPEYQQPEYQQPEYQQSEYVYSAKVYRLYNVKLLLTPYKSRLAAKLRLKGIANIGIRFINQVLSIFYFLFSMYGIAYYTLAFIEALWKNTVYTGKAFVQIVISLKNSIIQIVTSSKNSIVKLNLREELIEIKESLRKELNDTKEAFHQKLNDINEYMEHDFKFTKLSVPYYLYKHKLPELPPDRYSTYVLHMHQVMHEFQPDIVHCFLPTSYHLGTIAHLLTSGRLHRKLLMSRVSLGFYFQGHPKLRWYETKFCHFFVKRVVGNARMIIDELRKESLPDRKLRLIYNGIDVEDFNRPLTAKKIAEQGKVIYLSTIANLHEYKGYGDLIEALGLLAKENITNWHLNIAGRDVDGAMAKHRARCQELNIYKRVTFLGQINHQQIIAHLHQSQIHIHPSHHEGLPNSILEAMSSELPVIATQVGGIPELVKDGESGILLPPHRPKELATAIKYLLQNPEIRQNMGVRGAQIARQNFTINLAVKNFEQLYTDVTKKSRLRA